MSEIDPEAQRRVNREIRAFAILLGLSPLALILPVLFLSLVADGLS